MNFDKEYAAYLFQSIGTELNESVYQINEPLFENEISDETLKTAATMFTYIIATEIHSKNIDKDYLKSWVIVYKEWMRTYSLRRLLGTFVK